MGGPTEDPVDKLSRENEKKTSIPMTNERDQPAKSLTQHELYPFFLAILTRNHYK